MRPVRLASVAEDDIHAQLDEATARLFGLSKPFTSSPPTMIRTPAPKLLSSMHLTSGQKDFQIKRTNDSDQ